MADDAGTQAWRAMLLAYDGAMRAIEDEVNRGGRVPLTWYDVLLELRAAAPDGLRMQDLAARVVLSRTRVSRLVDEMVQAGLVRKHPDDRDRRVTWAVITESGTKALRETAPVYLDGISRHFAQHLTATELATLTRALSKVARVHGKGAPVRGAGRGR